MSDLRPDGNQFKEIVAKRKKETNRAVLLGISFIASFGIASVLLPDNADKAYVLILALLISLGVVLAVAILRIFSIDATLKEILKALKGKDWGG